MYLDAILQITSSANSAIGTGFVIDIDTIATCSHVVSSCGADNLLVNGLKATLVADYAKDGLDLAILKVDNLGIEPLTIEAKESKKVKIYGYTHFNTTIRKNIKGEWIKDIDDAQYSVSLSGKGETISMCRLSSKKKISNGYSGSPVICQESGVVVAMVAIEMSGNSSDSFTNYAISTKHILQKYNFSTKPKKSSSIFIKEVFDSIDQNHLVVLFSQDFTDITQNQNLLKAEAKERFSNGFYHFRVPQFLDDSRVYFKTLSKSCGFEKNIDNPHDWKVAMQDKLKSSPKRVILFITDIENGNVTFDKQFAIIVRSLVSEFSNLSALFIGKKNLAYLVYGESTLSPLNTAKELFFPDDLLKIDDDLIERQFLTLNRYRDSICKYLKKDRLGRYKVWSFNKTINALFWKNLLIRDGKYFVWRDDITKEIGNEIFECDELSE